MNAYDLMIKTNHYLIKGGTLSAPQKDKIVRGLLTARSGEREKQGFYKGVKYQNNTDGEGNIIGTYPAYFIPPFNGGKKPQTVIPMSPKTHILSSNSYELEILRLLSLFAPENPAVKEMVAGTVKRLRTACFARDCVVGECFHSSLIVLRFLASVLPRETEWLTALTGKIGSNIEDKLKGKNRIHGNTQWYYWLCLSELPDEVSGAELLRYKDELRARLGKSYVMNSESDKIHHPVLLCILRNCLCHFPEYAYIKSRAPYTNEKDGRLYFDLD